MKILMYGDSITDMNRKRDYDGYPECYGNGYVFYVAGDLLKENPLKYQIINRGISGNRIVDLYARIKADVWNHEPDVLSILIGINDIWHEVAHKNGVDIERFDRMYRMLIEDTKKRFPNMEILLCEPFVLEGSATKERYEEFLQAKEYAKVVQKIAEDYGVHFLPLQDKLEKAAKEYTVESYLYDGVHPALGGARLIADEWVKLFKEKIDK